MHSLSALHTTYRLLAFLHPFADFLHIFSGHVTRTFIAQTFCKISIVMAPFRKLRYFLEAQIGSGLLCHIYRLLPLLPRCPFTLSQMRWYLDHDRFLKTIRSNFSSVLLLQIFGPHCKRWRPLHSK